MLQTNGSDNIRRSPDTSIATKGERSLTKVKEIVTKVVDEQEEAEEEEEVK